MQTKEKSFNQLYSENYSKVKNFFAFRLGKDNPAIDELTNDTFIKVYNSFENFDGKDATISTWIITIAKNIHIDHYRRENRLTKIKTNSYNSMVSDNGSEYFQPSDGKSVEKIYIENEISHAMQLAISALPPKLQPIADYWFNQDLLYREIAEKLNIPIGTVKGSINRIKSLVKENYFSVA